MNTMSWRAVVLVAGVLALVGCASAPTTRAPETTGSIDAARFYSGTWREIGRRPISLTDGCVAGATAFQRIDETRLRVRDTCQRGTPTGREAAVGGPAVIMDPGRNTKFRVHYRLYGFIPVTRDYWVLEHDPDYTWFISTDPTFTDLWIYTRSPQPSAALVARLTERAAALGYDVSKLEFPAQPAA